MSSKPNIPVKQTDDQLTAEEVNTIVDFFEVKGDSSQNPGLLKFNFVGGSETNTPLLSPSDSGWDQVIREIGNIIIYEGNYIMVYSGYIDPYEESFVGIATSQDGNVFTKKGLNNDGQLTFTPSEDPYIIEKDGTFYIYVEKKLSGSTHLGIQLFTASSFDNLLNGTLTDIGLVLDKGEASEWDDQDVSSPTVFYNEDGFTLIFEGRANTGNSGAMGIATSSDGINFTKNENNPVASGTQLNGDVSWATHLVPDDIFYQNGVYYVTIHAYNGTTFAGGMICSSDLLVWRDFVGGEVYKQDGVVSFGNGFQVFFNERINEYQVSYTNSDNEIVKGYFTVKNYTPESGQDLPFVAVDGNVGLGTNNPQRKYEISDVKNKSIIRLTSTTSDSSWVFGDIHGSLEFYSKDGSSGGEGVLASIKCIDEAVSTTGNWPLIAFSIRQPIGGVGFRDVIYIGRNGELYPSIDSLSSLGRSSNRWTTIYATTGTINTSDINEKQDIEEITGIEKTIATQIKSKIKKFRFKDAVSIKGSDARIHFGVIAQEVRDCFIENGLNPYEYGLFCEDKWYTVNGSPAEKDSKGAVEHIRLGIRYDELLCFIISSM